jgi:hypothetical protein
MGRDASLRRDARGGAAPAQLPAGGGVRRRRCAGRSADAPRDTAPRGAICILRDLTNRIGTVPIGNVSEFGFNKSGRYLAS